MKDSKPLLIVLTPVFNEAWILPAFLKATSLWADYIIIADQMSTDGSRELYDAFRKEADINITPSNPNKHQCQLIIIDNPRKEMHQAATRRLLFEEAKKIEGDKILFTLDADEFLSGNFTETEGWKTILNSEPGDVFEFRWMNLSLNPAKYSISQPYYYWALHPSDDFIDGKYPDNFIHEMRLPWPPKVISEYQIDDIRFIHFARVNASRQNNKVRFYQVSQSASLGKYSGVKFYRMYHPVVEDILYDIPKDAYKLYDEQGIDIFALISLEDAGSHYTDGVLRRINEKGVHYFHKLDIWDSAFLKQTGLSEPRNAFDKMVNWYLRKTNRYSNTFMIRAIDYLLKKVY